MPKPTITPKKEHSLQGQSQVITSIGEIADNHLSWLDDFGKMSIEKQVEILQKNPEMFEVIKRLKIVLENIGIKW